MSIAAAMHNRDQFKLYVSNLNNFMSQKEALKLFRDRNIPGIKSVKKQRGKTFAFIMFNSIEEREEAKSLLEAIEVGGKHLTCKDANAQKKRSNQKRRNDEGGDRAEKRSKSETESGENKTTNDVVAPWWNVPYEEQTSRKEREMRQVLKRCNRRISRKDSDKEKKKVNRAGSVKQPCRDFMSKGSCMYGDRCKYLHLTMDEWEAQLRSEKPSQEKQADEGISTEQTDAERDKVSDIPPQENESNSTERRENESNSTERKENEQTSDTNALPEEKNERPIQESDAEEYERTSEEEGQLCTMLPILTHPVIQGYRNKCTFTIGKNREGSPCIGFRMGSFIDGNVVIGEVEDVVVVSPLMKRVVRIVQDFVRSRSYQPYDMCSHLGFWRSLLLRHSERTNQLMVLLVVGNPYERSLARVEEANAKLTDAIRGEIDGVLRDLLSVVTQQIDCVASFGYQIFTGLSMPGSDCALVTLQGQPFIEERLFGLTFRVSPYAFFQVNTPVAEVLYRNIGDWLSLHENTLLLDVCCGTGTIGLCLASRVKYLIGVDIEASAIEDARLNARVNGITNCEFICSPAEKVMADLLRREDLKQYDHIVMIVDPPRSGLHKDIIPACRKCDAITELIYVSCNPTGSFVENTISLCCQPNRRVPGHPFVALKSQPVDLFPYTEHCELMTLFAHM